MCNSKNKKQQKKLKKKTSRINDIFDYQIPLLIIE